MSEQKGTSSDHKEEEAQVTEDSEKEIQKKAEEEAKKTSKEDDSENSDKGDDEGLSEAEKVRRAADSQISKMSNEVSKYQKIVLEDIKNNPEKLYDLYETDKDLALQLAESNPALIEEALKAHEKALELETDEDGEKKHLSEEELESWYSKRRKKENAESMKQGIQDRQIDAIAKFLTSHPEIEKGSDLEKSIFSRFRVYVKPDSKPDEISTILDDALSLSNMGSYQAGADDAILKGATNAAAASSTGGKGSEPKKVANLTTAQKEFCDKNSMNYEEYARFI